MREQQKDELIEAVLYALRSGCFFPVPQPTAGATVAEFIKWGAMRNLHDKIAALDRLPIARATQA